MFRCSVNLRQFAFLVVSFVQAGCIMKRTGTNAVRVIERDEETALSRSIVCHRCDAVQPEVRRYPTGLVRIELVAEGDFDETDIVRVNTMDVRNEWAAVGFLPGTESMWKGYGGRGKIIGKEDKDKDGNVKKPLCAGYLPLTGQILANAFLVGLPTICSLFVEPFLEPADFGKRRFGEGGLIGIYRYKGSEYEVSNGFRKERRDLKVQRVLLKDYDVVVAGEKLHVGDGKVFLDLPEGDCVVKLLSVPKSPKGLEKELPAFVGFEFHVTIPPKEDCEKWNLQFMEL